MLADAQDAANAFATISADSATFNGDTISLTGANSWVSYYTNYPASRAGSFAFLSLWEGVSVVWELILVFNEIWFQLSMEVMLELFKCHRFPISYLLTAMSYSKRLVSHPVIERIMAASSC